MPATAPWSLTPTPPPGRAEGLGSLPVVPRTHPVGAGRVPRGSRPGGRRRRRRRDLPGTARLRTARPGSAPRPRRGRPREGWAGPDGAAPSAPVPRGLPGACGRPGPRLCREGPPAPAARRLGTPPLAAGSPAPVPSHPAIPQRPQLLPCPTWESALPPAPSPSAPCPGDALSAPQRPSSVPTLPAPALAPPAAHPAPAPVPRAPHAAHLAPTPALSRAPQLPSQGSRCPQQGPWPLPQPCAPAWGTICFQMGTSGESGRAVPVRALHGWASWPPYRQWLAGRHLLSYCLTFSGTSRHLLSVTLGEGGAGRKAALSWGFLLAWPGLCQGTVWDPLAQHWHWGRAAQDRDAAPKKGKKKPHQQLLSFAQHWG